MGSTQAIDLLKDSNAIREKFKYSVTEMRSPDKQEPRPIHRMYVLRLWRDGPSGPWRASVKTVASKKEVHFANLESLCVYLQSETAPEADDARRDHL